MSASTAGPTRASLALRVIADVAHTLTSGPPSQDVLTVVVGALQAGFGAGACRIWVREPDGRRYRAIGGPGASVPQPLAVADADRWSRDASQTDGPTLRAPLVSEGERLGFLEVVTASAAERALADEVIPIVVNILAPLLATIELSQDLASEVASSARELEAQRTFIGKIIDSLPVGLYVIDRNYVIQAWNRKRETGTQGVSREKALGRTVFEILHRQPRELLKSEFDEVFIGGGIKQMELESTASGQARHYRITKIPMRLEGDDVSHVITIGEDVTEASEARQQIAHSEKLAAIGQLAAGVMHEINNPLATISACSEALALHAEGVPPAQQASFAEYLQIIDNEIRRCKRIVDELLDFSRPKLRNKGPINVNHAIKQALFLLKHHDRFKRVRVVQELSDQLPPVLASEEHLVQVFIALMLNASDAMELARAGSALTVRTAVSPGGGEMRIDFIDAGVGIPRHHLDKIFEPFFTTKPQGRGTGLGLSICYGLIAEHGGRIEVDSQEGQGSRFSVLLPVAR